MICLFPRGWSSGSCSEERRQEHCGSVKQWRSCRRTHDDAPVHVHCGLIWDDCETAFARRFCEARPPVRGDHCLRKSSRSRLPLHCVPGRTLGSDRRQRPSRRRSIFQPRNPAPQSDVAWIRAARRGAVCNRCLCAGRPALRKVGSLLNAQPTFGSNRTLALGTTADNNYRDGSRDYFDKCEQVLSLEAGRIPSRSSRRSLDRRSSK